VSGGEPAEVAGTVIRYEGGPCDGEELFLPGLWPETVNMAIACIRNGRTDSVSVRLLEDAIVEATVRAMDDDPHMQDFLKLEALANGGDVDG